MRDSKINCIDQSGCAAPIPESELRRFLPDGMMKLWERVKQRKEIEAAGLGGLEECPFCDYAVIIDDAEDKLLRCENLDVCGVVSCRTCKKSVSKLFCSPRGPLMMYGMYRIIFRRPVTVRCISTNSIGSLTKILRVTEVDSVLDGRHAVEEAMSSLVPFFVSFLHTLIAITGQALFRNCPSCKKGLLYIYL
jgi:hypothetical protein